jgi:hypothetical protein
MRIRQGEEEGPWEVIWELELELTWEEVKMGWPCRFSVRRQASSLAGQGGVVKLVFD